MVGLKYNIQQDFWKALPLPTGCKYSITNIIIHQHGNTLNSTQMQNETK